MRELRGATAQQAIGLAGGSVLAAGIVTAVALGRQSLAVALAGLLVVAVLLAVLQVRRRLGETRERLGRGTQQVRRDIAGVREQIGALTEDRDDRSQRRILAAIENERLAAAERQRALLSGLDEAQSRIQRAIGDRARDMRHRYVDLLVRAFAAEARSLIDVGSGAAPLTEGFDWIPRRDALDLERPHRSEGVRGIGADFLTYVPEERYDLALCLDVLEHVPEAARFARHLFEVADSVLVSVPLAEGEGSTPGRRPVSRQELLAWTGREPDYDVVVAEPLYSQEHSLIAYFHSPRSTFSLAAARDRLRGALGGARTGM